MVKRGSRLNSGFQIEVNVRKYIIALFLLSSTALADRSVKNLQGIAIPCFPEYSFSAAKVLLDASPALKDEVIGKMKSRLQAYKVYNGTCSKGSYFLSITIDAFKLTSGNLAYVMELHVFDTIKYPDWASVWSQMTYGSTGQTGSKLAQDFASSAADLVDDFAADYNTANP